MLLVAGPIVSAASATCSPSAVRTTTPTAAGPGLPRDPPSTLTTSLVKPCSRSDFGFRLARRDHLLGDVPGDLLVAQELERVVAATAGDRSQVRRVVEHLGHRDLGLDLSERALRL